MKQCVLTGLRHVAPALVLLSTMACPPTLKADETVLTTYRSLKPDVALELAQAEEFKPVSSFGTTTGHVRPIAMPVRGRADLAYVVAKP